MEKILPNGKNSYYELRFHSIGGQGAYTTGQMVATTASSIEGLQTSIFASYGSEKKGAPINVFVRFYESEKKITNYSAVIKPNLVAVFHENLLKTQDVLQGIVEDGKIIVNTPLSAQELVDTYDLKCSNITTLDATAIGVKTGAKINTIMYGAIVQQLDFIDADAARNQITDMLSYKYPQLVPSNIEAFDLGLEAAIEHTVNPGNGNIKIISVSLGANNQIPGGIIEGVNTHLVDRSMSREGYMPGFEIEKCINCTKCDSSCPDDCFVWEEVEGRRGRMEMTLKGIDYMYCKGCLRCVEACPTDALTSVVETRGAADLITKKKVFDFIK